MKHTTTACILLGFVLLQGLPLRGDPVPIQEQGFWAWIKLAHNWDASALQQGFNGRLGLELRRSPWLNLRLEASQAERGYANQFGVAWWVAPALFPVDHFSAGVRFVRTRVEPAQACMRALGFTTLVQEGIFSFEAGIAFLSLANEREPWNSAPGNLQGNYLLSCALRVPLIKNPGLGWQVAGGFSSHDGFELVSSEMMRFFLSNQVRVGRDLLLQLEVAAWYSNLFDYAGFWTRHTFSLTGSWRMGTAQ